MKVTKTTEPKTFKPFTISIEIETLEELKTLQFIIDLEYSSEALRPLNTKECANIGRMRTLIDEELNKDI